MTKNASKSDKIPTTLESFNRDLHEKRPEETAVSKLHFDPDNPRLAESANTSSQESLFTTISKHFDIQPIVDSLYRSGYFHEEPLVAVRERLPGLGNAKKLVVIEGNRRLAALRTVHENPDVYNDEAARKRLESVPVIIRDNREETLAFVGFRHITGVKPWVASGKALYAHRLVEQGATIRQIAALIGDKTADIERWIRTQSLISKAEGLGIDPADTAKSKFHFSYLLTATDAPATKDWLRLKCSGKTGLVQAVDDERLKQLWLWLYGSKQREISPVVPESRQIHKLNRILGDRQATSELQKGGDLDRALIEIEDPAEFFLHSLGSTRSSLQDLAAVLAGRGSLQDLTNDQELIRDIHSEIRRIDGILSQVKDTAHYEDGTA